MRNSIRVFEKKHTVMLISAFLAAAVLLLALLGGTQISAWFTSRLDVDNRAQLTNFVTKVEYSFDGTAWTSLDSDEGIIVTPDTINDLNIKVYYQGESAAYLRASIYGSFVNRHTNTLLPQPDDFWNCSHDENWVKSGEYFYYTTRLQDRPDFEELSTLTVHVDMSVFGAVSEHQDYTGTVYVLVDAVQPDRYPAFWGIPSLPFS